MFWQHTFEVGLVEVPGCDEQGFGVIGIIGFKAIGHCV